MISPGYDSVSRQISLITNDDERMYLKTLRAKGKKKKTARRIIKSVRSIPRENKENVESEDCIEVSHHNININITIVNIA